MSKTARILTVCFCVVFSFYAFNVKAERPVSELMKNAENALKNRDIYNAIDYMKLAWEKDTTNYQLAYRIANLNFSVRDYKQAKHFFEKVYHNAVSQFPESAFYYANVLKMNGDCEKAMPVFEKLAGTYTGDNRRYYRTRSQQEYDGCLRAFQYANLPIDYRVLDPGRFLNTPYSNLSPLWWSEGELIFSTLNTDTVISVNPRTPSGHQLQFYHSKYTNGQWSQAELFKKFNDIRFHTANGAFSPDKKRFYFTRCREDRNMVILCAIYRSDFVNGQWTEAEKLPSNINLSNFTQTHPAVGNTSRGREVLYFVSDREGGRGGLDIWFSIINPDGSYRDPINAGPVINSENDEVTPWYDNNDGILYFSSNGQVGFGGFDIYKTEGEMRRWSEPQNLGYPFNSHQDEMYFKWKDESRTNAVMVSNRPGETPSLRSPTCCDNIYFLEFDKSFFLAVKGRVFDYDNPEAGPLSPSPIALYRKNEEDYFKTDTTRNDNTYFFILNERNAFRVMGSHEGYLSASVDFETHNAQNRDTLEVNIYLRKLEIGKAYRLENVYYDFDKWDLRPESKETLDTLYRIMIENPNIIVELSSHTDQRGSVAYNNVLSQRRAESCMRYLISEGIDRQRLRARGYGKSRILEDCNIYPDCPMDSDEDCPCHQFNRRTEFTVIGELDGELHYDDVRYGE